MNDFKLELRKTTLADLAVLFQFQLDLEANYLAAFTPLDPGNKEAYIEKFTKHLKDSTIHMKTIMPVKL